MKISTRSILRILRSYHIANDDTPVRAIRLGEVKDYESYLQVPFVFGKTKFMILFGSSVDEESLSELWPNKPPDTMPLKNPLDESGYVMPFLGKYVMLFQLQPTKQRLDTYLANYFDTTISRSLWQKYISAGYVKVNDEVVTISKTDIDETDSITVTVPIPSTSNSELRVLYEDADVLVIDKPSGILTHAKGGLNTEQTVADIVRDKTTYGLDTDRPGIVHRLDRDTSGVIIVARTPDAATILQKQFADRKTEKTYLAVVSGTPKLTEAKIDLPIGRNPSKPSTFRVDPKGKSAQTSYKVLGVNGAESLVELKPYTGRTHQLRVHMAHIGNPIIGDRVYGKKATRLLLHAYQLRIRLPNGGYKAFTSTLPDEISSLFPEVKP